MGIRVQKWGNSQGLRLARHILESSGLAVGDEVEVEVVGEQIVIKRAKVKFDLTDMLQRLPDDYQVEELAWGEPVGREAW